LDFTGTEQPGPEYTLDTQGNYSDEELDPYFNGQFEEDLKEWARAMGDMCRNQWGAFCSRVGRYGSWEQAFLYLMAMKRTNGRAITTVTWTDQGGTHTRQVVNPSLKYGEESTYYEMIAPYNYDKCRPGRTALILKGAQEWNRISVDKDSEEYKLFTFYMLALKAGAINEAGVIENDNFSKTHWFIISWKTHHTAKIFNQTNFAEYDIDMDNYERENSVLELMIGGEDNTAETEALNTAIAVAAGYKETGFNVNGIADAKREIALYNTMSEYVEQLEPDEKKGSLLDVLKLMCEKAEDIKEQAENDLKNRIVAEKLNQQTKQLNFDERYIDLKNTESANDFDEKLEVFKEQATSLFYDSAYMKKDVLLRYYNFYKDYINENIDRMSYSNPIFTKLKDMMDAEKQKIEELYTERLTKCVELEERKWAVMADDFQRQKKQILDTMTALKERGTRAFAHAEEDLREAREAWLVKFEEEYKAKEAKWNEAYAEFSDDWEILKQ